MSLAKSSANSPITVSKFYENEDRQAQNLTNENITKELEEITGFMRAQIDTNADALQKDAKARDALLLKAVMLRRLNRLSNFRNRLLRERLAASRAKVDAHYLQLQNIRCGIAHLKSATAACLEFQSMDSDLDLVPVNEFYARAPESISRPEVTRAEEHQLHLARLNFELEERKSMLANQQELEGRKSVLLSDIHGKEQRLRQIKPKIAALMQSARPLLDILGLKSVEISVAETQKRFAHLPQQLDLLRINVGVFNELFGEHIEVSAEGDVQKAERFIQAEARRSAVVVASDEEDDDVDNDEEDDEDEVDEMDVDREEVVSKSSKKSRKRKSRRSKTTVAEKVAALAAPAEDADDLGLLPASDRSAGDSAVKAAGAAITATSSSSIVSVSRGAKAVEKRLQQKRDALLNTHPICLCLLIPLPNLNKRKGAKLRLSFHYLTELGCVGVKCKIVDTEVNNWQLLDGEHLLDNLFNADLGDNCSNPTAKGLLNALNTDIGKYALVVGKPYDFAQKLCGFPLAVKSAADRMATTNEREDLREKSVGDRQMLELLAEVVERARARVAARFVLANVAVQLENLKGESILSIVPGVDCFPSKVFSRLLSFQSITTDEALTFPGLSPPQKSLLLRLNEEGAAVYYKLNVERVNESTQAQFSLDAVVYVPHAYPRHAPVFLLVIRSEAYCHSIDYSMAINELERYVNSTVVEDSRFDPHNNNSNALAPPDIFTFQVAALCSRLDAVLEVTAKRLAVGDSQPEFASEYIYIALSRLGK